MSALYFFQEKIIFLPTQLAPDYEYQFERDFEELVLETKDGAKLNALHFKRPNPKGLILYFHGNAGDLSRWGEITAYFDRFNYEVLVMDYRTYGKSTGKLDEAKLYEDAELFYTKALSLVSEEKLVVYGRSLGCTFATSVAANHNPSQLILETPFYGLEALVKEKYPILPLQSLLKYQFPSFQFVPRITCVTTIIHGTEDTVVPYVNGEKLHQEFDEGQSQFITVVGGDHNDLVNFETYHSTMKRLLGSKDYF